MGPSAKKKNTKTPEDILQLHHLDDKLKGKVVIHLRAVGNAPILKRTKIKIKGADKFSKVIVYLRKCLKTKTEDSIFLFVNQAFCPGPDTIISDLHECYGTGNEVIVNYALTQAWG